MSQNYIGKTLSALLVALVVMGPASLAFAKENGERGEREREDRKELRKELRSEKSENKGKGKKEDSCIRAFGHLIAPGFIKLFGETEVKAGCNLPFGIGKKFGDNGTGTASSTDTTAPVISNVASNPGIISASISWTTDERAMGDVFVSRTPSVNIDATSTIKVSEGSFFKTRDKTRDHRIIVRDLAASTTYYAVIRTADKAGNTSRSAEFSFTTKAPEVTNDTLAPTISSVATVSGGTNVAIGWKTNEPATSKVYYSANTPVNVAATTTASVGSADLTGVHFVVIPNLSTSTKYYFVAESKDAAGNARMTSEFSATTLLGL